MQREGGLRKSLNIWDKVFKSGLKLFKGCHSQNLLSPLLNTLFHLWIRVISRWVVDDAYQTGFTLEIKHWLEMGVESIIKYL